MNIKEMLENYDNVEAAAVALILDTYRARGYGKAMGLAVELLSHISEGPGHVFNLKRSYPEVEDWPVDLASAKLESFIKKDRKNPDVVRALNGVLIFKDCYARVLSPDIGRYLIEDHPND